MREGPQTTGQLTKELTGLSRFAVMQHLGVLEDAGLVLFRCEGRNRFNYLNPIPLREMYERWTSPLSSTAAETALHLRRYAETTKEVAQQMDQTPYRHVNIEMEMRINASQERVFRAATVEFPNWWPHRFKPGSTIIFEPQMNGRIGELWDGGFASYGIVVYLDPPVKCAYRGPGGLPGSYNTFSVDTFEADGDATILKRKFVIWGDVPEDLEKMFREGTRALMEQSLKRYCEEGIGYEACPEPKGERGKS